MHIRYINSFDKIIYMQYETVKVNLEMHTTFCQQTQKHNKRLVMKTVYTIKK